MMQYNFNPVSLREGSIFIDGIQAYDEVSCTINFTPDVWEGRLMGDITPSSRWMGAKISGQIKRRRATKWQKDLVKKYLNRKETPEITITGICDDKASEYFSKFGKDITTLLGVVLTGDISILQHDAEGNVVEDTVNFNAKDMK